MDTNMKVVAIPKKSSASSLAKSIVIDAINNNPQCFWPDIVKESDNRTTTTDLSKACKELLKDKTIRLRECSYEHAWEYVLKRK